MRRNTYTRVYRQIDDTRQNEFGIFVHRPIDNALGTDNNKLLRRLAETLTVGGIGLQLSLR